MRHSFSLRILLQLLIIHKRKFKILFKTNILSLISSPSRPMNKPRSSPSPIYDVQPAEDPILFSFMLKFYHFFKAELKSSLAMNTFSPLQSTMILFLNTLLIFSLILPHSSTDTIAVYIVFQTVGLAIYSHKWPCLVDTILF